MGCGRIGEDGREILHGGPGSGGEEVHEDEVEDGSHDKSGEDEIQLIQAEIGPGCHVTEDAGGDANELLHQDLEGELGISLDAGSPSVDERPDDGDIGRLRLVPIVGTVVRVVSVASSVSSVAFPAIVSVRAVEVSGVGDRDGGGIRLEKRRKASWAGLRRTEDRHGRKGKRRGVAVKMAALIWER